ncbi:hypothetical protein HanIR_Chr15g0765441 [Helianthus annuus]|nr:hypothetical protein HanIR_Chr15g0765441 [Helianthus annuus]
MAETNPSHQVDREVSSFELISDTAHVQRGQRNEIIQEGTTIFLVSLEVHPGLLAKPQLDPLYNLQLRSSPKLQMEPLSNLHLG